MVVIREAMTWWGPGPKGKWNLLRSVQEVWESEQEVSAKSERSWQELLLVSWGWGPKQKSKYEVQNYPDNQDSSGKDPRKKISIWMELDSLS